MELKAKVNSRSGVTVSEDVKPRQFFIHNSKEIGEIKISGNLLFATTEKPIKPVNHEVIPVIELDPTLQLMKEMGEVFEKLGVRGCEYFNSSDYPDPYGLHIKHRKDCIRCMSEKVLDKYRKFLEGIK